MVRRFLAGAGLAALLIPGALGAGAASATPEDPVDRFAKAPITGTIDPAVLPAGMDDSSTVKVMIQLSQPPVAEVQAEAGKELSKEEQKQIERSLQRQQKAIVASVKAQGGTVLAQTQYAFNGVKASVSRKQVAELAQQNGVLAVRQVAVYELSNATAVPFLGVPQVWEDTGFTGDGAKIAIIDTGIDYTHADFGGPGTVEAFEAASAASALPADPAMFGPDAPRVKGGWDFVGDNYDANDPASVPMPDPNPLDCYGHGSHVAGSAAGSGVNADGSTYTGPYDASTSANAFKIGPGVAPEAELYALRVFGCGGSTDVTVEAIDWAVENDIDVINMSLGSTYGLRDDSSAIASSNATKAGVVVVASAGNEGPNPYLVGSPSTGDGVISVAAMDATEIFPGAEITLPDGSTIPAISANGIVPDAEASHTVVVLEDNPDTAENEALGCSVAAFTSNGIVEGGDQLAVTVRGTCARVARAVFGQQAGAAAVAMVNSDASFPPYEGPITENPDDGSPYDVTIAFLGVRGVLGASPTDDGDALVAAEGEDVSYAAVPLDNPGFRTAASFSSGGPRTGDSHLTPSVAAPGVAISSVAVGSGSDAAIMSGTSMAAPMVAGVAALGVQAHPTWTGLEISNAIVATADRDGLADYRLTLEGNGLVDVAQTVTNQVLAYGDPMDDTRPSRRAPGAGNFTSTLSFGFAESATTFTGTKTVTVVNKGNTAQTYEISTVASPQSEAASVTVSPSSITVRAGQAATVQVTLSANAANVPSSSDVTQHAFHEISGQVLLRADSGDLNVPYLLVPRSLSKGEVESRAINPQRLKTVTATLTNEGGALPATMDFYTWGLQDAQDRPCNSVGSRMRCDRTTEGATVWDLRAAGVQSFDVGGGDALLVFAINNWDRYSNAAAIEHDILIDTDRDGEPDKAVFVIDYGLVATGSADGQNAVFVSDLATGSLSVEFLATSPTDSSTVLAPVYASDLGLETNESFRYQVQSYDLLGTGMDAMPGVAEYNPWQKALDTDGGFFEVAPGESVEVDITADLANWRSQRPLGHMIVAFDNAAGADEALLIGGR